MFARSVHEDVTVEDVAGDRQVRVEVRGAHDGFPVFLLHGMPGSRLGPRPRDFELYTRGIRLISYDRPGYGGSSRQQGRTVARAAGDVAAIAERLGLERFSVVGRSAGGPHALACAALLPDQVVRAAVMVSLAPMKAPGLEWSEGMADVNIQDLAGGQHRPSSQIERMRKTVGRAFEQPQSFLDEYVGPGLSDADHRVVRNVPIRRELLRSYLEAFRQGIDGWWDDIVALNQDWGFDLRSIRVPVRVWHGAEDQFSPPSHARWLSAQIPGVEVQVEPGIGHFGAMEVLPRILSWAVDGRWEQARLPAMQAAYCLRDVPDADLASGVRPG